MKSHFSAQVAGWLAALAVIIGPVSSAGAFDVLQTSEGQEYRWKTAEIPFYVNADGFKDFGLSGDELERKLESIAQSSVGAWAAINAGYEFKFMGFTDVKSAGNDDMNVIFWVQDSASWNTMFPTQPNALAMTRLWATTSGRIDGFDMAFNDAAYTFTFSEDPALSSYDVQNTLVHELGHVLGLDHSDVPEATMYHTSIKGEISKRDLDLDDINGIRYLYQDGFAEETNPFGCSTVTVRDIPASSPLLGLLLVTPFVLIRRRQRE